MKFCASTAALTAACAFQAAAQEAAGPAEGGREKSFRIVRAAAAPVIDGVLDEIAWQTAARIDDLHEIQPTEYAPATEPTLIYVMYDDHALYVGARLFDRDPSQITARILRQGEQVFGDDWFSVMLDPFHDRRSGYRFQTNPNGLREEALYANISEEKWEWQGIWDVAAAINAEGWVAEMAIPFKTLSFDPSNDTWGINFRRAIARRDERMGWVSRNRNTDPSTSGIAVGFENPQQGMGLDVAPSLSVSEQRLFDGAGSDSDLDPSLDVFYKITPGLTAAITINTDFSATDVDDRQVNLTRFDLFFPEKRDFFLQDADIFEFGGLEENGRPFFSRRIGLAGTGELVDLAGGAKLSGRVGRWNVGALSIRQDELGGIAAANATVARASANLLEESNVGAIVTVGNPAENVDNSLAGVDFLYRNSRLPGGRVVEVNAWAQESDTEGYADGQSAYGFRLGMPNNSGFRGGFRFTELEENFNPGLGFVNRRGIRSLNYGTQYTHRPRAGYLRLLLGGFNGERFETLAGDLQSQEIRYRLIELESRRNDSLFVQRAAYKEVLEEPFLIAPHKGIELAPGTYEFYDTRVQLTTGDQRKLWMDVVYRVGEFYSGEREEIYAEVNWRPSGRLRTSLAYGVNDIELPEGDFVTRLVQFRTDVAFSATLSWVTRVQYDNVSERLGVHLRLHWIPEAGREAFLVLNHRLQDLDLDNRFESELAEAAVKFGYTFRF
jgi:hypothetical protein